MRYSPRPALDSKEDVNRAILDILQRIERLETLLFPLFNANVVEPKAQEGMIAWADGVNWDPGAGAGLYHRMEGVWNKL